VGFRKRAVVCRFGSVTISRRLYQDGAGDYCFLLDEHLEWEAYQVATPSVGEAAVSLAAAISFRETAAILEKVTAGVLSPHLLNPHSHVPPFQLFDEKREYP
jgi:hypothetical protein